MSPPTLHILITGTIHHVCTQRTPRSTGDTTTIPNDFCKNSTTRQQITSHTGNHKHEWRATHHVPITLWSENMCCMISITNQINLQISIESLMAASCTLTRVYITECTKNNTQQKSPTHSILPQLTTMICTRSLCSMFRSHTIRNVANTMPDVSIIHLPKHPVRTQTHSQNNESPPTLDILITRSVHHVCARRTQRGLVANNNANDNCSRKWYHVLQLSTRHNGKKMPQHNNTTTPRRCSDVSITRVLAQNFYSSSAKQHATSTSEHRHHGKCPSREHPNCDSRLNNSTQDWPTSQNVVEKWNCQQNHTTNFPSPTVAQKRITETKTTPHDLGFGQNLYPSEPTMNLQTFNRRITLQVLETERTATTPHNTTPPPHPITPPRQPLLRCVHHPSSSAHGFCTGSFAEQRVTSDTGHAHQRNRPCVPKRPTACDSWARLFAHTQNYPKPLAHHASDNFSIVHQIMQHAST